MFATGPGKPERIFYIIYWKDARMVKQQLLAGPLQNIDLFDKIEKRKGSQYGKR